jgi:hypothetical protein
MKRFYFVFYAVILGLSFIGCENPAETDGVSYPYTGHAIEYMGFKGGLSSSSSDAEFLAGLNEVFEDYKARNSDSSEIIFDGVAYEIVNLQPITGGVPAYVIEQYGEDLSKYSYSIGSCWSFIYGEIPSKRGTATVYALFTIVSSYYGRISYSAYKATARPK